MQFGSEYILVDKAGEDEMEEFEMLDVEKR